MPLFWGFLTFVILFIFIYVIRRVINNTEDDPWAVWNTWDWVVFGITFLSGVIVAIILYMNQTPEQVTEMLIFSSDVQPMMLPSRLRASPAYSDESLGRLTPSAPSPPVSLPRPGPFSGPLAAQPSFASLASSPNPFVDLDWASVMNTVA